MAATGGGSNDNVQESTTQDAIGNIQQINLELKRLIDARNNKNSEPNPIIREIVNSTVRKVDGLIAGKSEFFYIGDLKPVRDGVSYHIHYTNDLSEYYMTGGTHGFNNKLISPFDFKKTDIGYYNALNKQSPLTIEGEVPAPTVNDYTNGSYVRYFAKNASDSSSPIFEVSSNVFNTSPLYEYISLTWHLTGTKAFVYTSNIREILLASLTFPNLTKFLSPFQFFKKSLNQTPVEKVKDRLRSSSVETNEVDTSSMTVDGGVGMLQGNGQGGY